MKILIRDREDLNLDGLDITELAKLENELEKLQKDVKEKMYKQTSLVKVLEEIKSIELEEYRLRSIIMSIRENDYTHSELGKLGFTITNHYYTHSIGIMNYEKEKKNDSYYGVQYFFKTKEFINSEDNPINDEEFKKIKEILGV